MAADTFKPRPASQDAAGRGRGGGASSQHPSDRQQPNREATNERPHRALKRNAMTGRTIPGSNITSTGDLATRIERVQEAHVVDHLEDRDGFTGLQICRCGAQLGVRENAAAQHVAQMIAEMILERTPDTEASIYVQWHGTNACIDFYCTCGAGGHYDGYFAHAIECPACHARFDLPTHPHLLPFSGRFEAKVAQA